MTSYSIVCFVTAFLFFLLFIHPFSSYLLSLKLLRKVDGSQPADTEPKPLTYSVVFCAYNEEAILPQKLENLLNLQQKYGRDRLNILAYSDCSSDRTDEILSTGLLPADGNLFIRGENRRGKSSGMNTLLEHASREIVIFTDANVLLDSSILEALDSCFSDASIGVACGNLIYINDATATADVGGKYWKLEEHIKQLETETGSAMGADGSLFATRRELFAPVPEDIIDDFCTSMRILCRGYRIVRVSRAVAYERSTDKVSDENKRKVRIACRAMNCHRFLKPQLKKLSLVDKYKYYSHKWIRWHAGYWLLACFVSIAVGLLSVNTIAGTLFLLAGAGAILAARVSYALDVPLMSKVWVVLSSLFYTSLGIFHSRIGKRYQTWTPPTSAR